MKRSRLLMFSSGGCTRRVQAVSTTLLAFSCAASWVTAGEPVPRNLGHGLYELVCRQQAASQPAAARAKTGYLDHTAAVQATRGMQFDEGGRVLVDLVLDGSQGMEPTRAALDQAAGGHLKVLAADKDYHAGIVEAYVPAENSRTSRGLPASSRSMPASGPSTGSAR